MYAERRAAQRRFGGIYQLPIVRRVRDVLLAEISSSDAVLEIGAGDRRYGELLRRQRAGAHYESLDPDPAGAHDYRDLEEIDRKYNVVAALEVIEHFEFEAARTWLAQVRNLLVPGGRLILSTPNTYHPPAWLRDATHRTPFCYDELAGLVTAAGLRVKRVCRVYHDPLHRKVARRYLLGWLFRILGIDFARQIVLVAAAPGNE